MIRFPYSSRRGRLFPIIPVTVAIGSHELDTDALVDSGANISVFRPEIAEYFEIEIESGREILLHGLGGRVIAYIHEVRMSIEKISFPCRVAFSRELIVGINILGRECFFEKFKVTLDERRKETILELQRNS